MADHPAAPPPLARRTHILGIVLIACAWCAGLAILIYYDSNPVVINRAQWQAATFVVQGQITRGTPSKLQVTQVWKGALAETTLVLAGPLPPVIPTGEVIVPISRGVEPGEYVITQGVLPNFREGLADEDAAAPYRPARVQPLVYPATPDVLQQLQKLSTKTP